MLNHDPFGFAKHFKDLLSSREPETYWVINIQLMTSEAFDYARIQLPYKYSSRVNAIAAMEVFKELSLEDQTELYFKVCATNITRYAAESVIFDLDIVQTR